jgi:hypothetical protein
MAPESHAKRKKGDKMEINEELIDCEEDEELDDDAETEPAPAPTLFHAADDGSVFVIEFDRIFDRERLSSYNDFDLSIKRNFKLMSSMIVETYDEVFLKEDKTFDEDLQIAMLHILNAQSKIMSESSVSAAEFIGLIDRIAHAGDDCLLKRIDDMIEKGYELTLDETTNQMRKKNKNVNDQLIISDANAKKIIKAAYLDRICIPLISQFFIYNKSAFPAKTSVIDDGDDYTEDLAFGEANQTIFLHIFEICAGEETANIESKLYKMVYARIMRNALSASRFWEKAKDLGISKESSSIEIYNKLISNSVPKILMTKETNPVNYFSVIINNQVMFLFSNKFKVHYQSLNPSSGGSVFESNDDDSMTEMEKIEMRLGRKNEGSLIINDVIAGQVIKKLDEYMDVSVTKEEINESLRYIHMNTIQERIVAMLTFKYFKSTDAIKRLTAYEYAKLLVCCVKFLEKNKFVLLPKILLSNCVKVRDRDTITGVKIKTKIEESKRYRELVEMKYKDFKSEVERNIQSFISTIKSSEFIGEDGEDIFDSSAVIGTIAEEIIDLCYLV